MKRLLILAALGLLLVVARAEATNTIYSVSYSGETAGMAGVANATEEDALSQAVNPANLTRIGSWRFDAGLGYLMSRVSYDDGGVNPDEFGYFEYQEGHDFVVPGFAYARRLSKRLVLGAGLWGNGGDAIVFRGLGFNDTTPADLGTDAGLGGNVQSFMTNTSDQQRGFGGLNGDNAVRRDNYATLQSGKVAFTLAYQIGPNLSLAITPTLDIGVLRFGTFGNFATTGPTSQIKGEPLPGKTFGQLFAGPTFPKILMDGNGATQIAGLFKAVSLDPTVGGRLVNDLTGATVAAAGGDQAAIPNAVQAALGSLTPDFAATFHDAGFGLSEMTGYAEGSGLSGFGYNTKVGLRWQVNDWLAIGANYSQKTRISMDHGTMNIDFSDQFRQAFNIGFRSAMAQQVLFGNMGNAFGQGLQQIASSYQQPGGPQNEQEVGQAIGQLLGGFTDPNQVAGVVPKNDVLGGAPGSVDGGFRNINDLTSAADSLLNQFAFLLGFRDDVATPFVSANVAQDPTTGNLAQVPNFVDISPADQAAFLNAVGIQIDAPTLGAILTPASWTDATFRAQMEQGFGVPATLPAADAFNAAFGGLAQQLAVTQKMDTQIDVDLPQQAGIGIEVKPAKRITLGLDFTWIDFSDAFERFAARIDGGGSNGDGSNTVIEKFLGLNPNGDSFTFAQDFSWKDQYIIAVGGAWEATDDLTLRLGYNHATNAITSEHATPLFPAFGFKTVAGGLSYDVGEHTKLSFAWEHAFDTRLKSKGNNKVDSQYSNADLNHNQDTAYLQVSWVH